MASQEELTVRETSSGESVSPLVLDLKLRKLPVLVFFSFLASFLSVLPVVIVFDLLNTPRLLDRIIPMTTSTKRRLPACTAWISCYLAAACAL